MAFVLRVLVGFSTLPPNTFSTSSADLDEILRQIADLKPEGPQAFGRLALGFNFIFIYERETEWGRERQHDWHVTWVPLDTSKGVGSP